MYLMSFMHVDNYTTFYIIIKKALKIYVKSFKM